MIIEQTNRSYIVTYKNKYWTTNPCFIHIERFEAKLNLNMSNSEAMYGAGQIIRNQNSIY